MSVFLEKYLLSVLAALTVLVVVTNPMGFDWTQRITGGLAVFFAAYFAAHTVHKLNGAKSLPQPQVAVSATSQAHQEKDVPVTKPDGAPISIRQTNPTNSPNIIGDHNTVSIQTLPIQRSLTPQQQAVLVERLTPLAKPSVFIITVNTNAEVETFANDFETLLRRCGWTVLSRSVSLVPSRGTGIGVYVKSQTEHPAAADALIAALRSVGLPVEAATASDLQADQVRLFVSSQ